MTKTNLWPKSIFLKMLVHIWMFPVTLFSFMIVLVLLLFRQIKASSWWNGGACNFVSIKDSKLFNKMSKDKWAAFTFSFFVVYRDDICLNDPIIRTHERVMSSNK